MHHSRSERDHCASASQAPFLDEDDQLLVGDLPPEASSSGTQQEPAAGYCNLAMLDSSAGLDSVGSDNDQLYTDCENPPELELKHPQQQSAYAITAADSSLPPMNAPIQEQTAWHPGYQLPNSMPQQDLEFPSPDHSTISSYYSSVSPSQPSDGVPGDYSTPMTPQDFSRHHGYGVSIPQHKSQTKMRHRRRKRTDELKYASILQLYNEQKG